MNCLLFLIILIAIFHTTLLSDAKRSHRRRRFRTINQQISEEKSLNGITLKSCGIKATKNYIVGGIVTDSNDLPFIVKIEGWHWYRNQYYHRCGGVILNEYWILSAAHCFHPFNGKIFEPEKYSVVIGTDRYNQSLIITHEKYKSFLGLNDIALIRLDRKIKFNSKYNSICLPSKQYEEPFGYLTVAGYGNTKTIAYEVENKYDILRKTELSIISDQKCSNLMANKDIKVFQSNLCSIYKGKSACSGDSGGPAFQYINGRAVLIGIVSSSTSEDKNECDGKYPLILTQVSYFLNWIFSKVE